MDCDGLYEGSAATCEVRGPFPYGLSFVVEIVELRPHELIRAEVQGDFAGLARLEIAPYDGGCEARLAWEVELRAAGLRTMAVWARPLMDWGHHWVVATGVSQFRRRAL